MDLSGIHGIATPPVIQPPQGQPAGGKAGGQTNFGRLIADAVGAVDQDQQASAASVEGLLTGRQQDVLPVVTAVARADASFKLLVGVRNKMIEAYKQTMSMQI